jgi:hypothetical protein
VQPGLDRRFGRRKAEDRLVRVFHLEVRKLGAEAYQTDIDDKDEQGDDISCSRTKRRLEPAKAIIDADACRERSAAG